MDLFEQLVDAVTVLADQNLTEGTLRLNFTYFIERSNNRLEDFLKVNLWQNFCPVRNYE
jgi:hypothetical protein